MAPPPSAIADDAILANGYSCNGSLLQSNPVGAQWIIQKFGGTSLGKFAESIAKDIIKYSPSFWQMDELCSLQSLGPAPTPTASQSSALP